MDKSYNLREAWDKLAKPPVGVAAPEVGTQTYTDEERAYVQGEVFGLYKQQVDKYRIELNELNAKAASEGKPSRVNRRFMLSAGAPGAGKTMLLEQLVANDKAFKAVMFMDPDERALKLMSRFIEDRRNFAKQFGDDDLVGLALSYTKWRWASNWVSNTMMNRAAEQGRDILLGTTATSPFMGVLYNNAHALGYESHTIIVCAPKEVREESARRRFEVEATRFTNDTDIKGKMFYERLPDLMKHTHKFSLYWRSNASEGAVLAASGVHGAILIHNQAAFEAIYNDLMTTTEGKLGLQSLMSTYMSRFNKTVDLANKL